MEVTGFVEVAWTTWQRGTWRVVVAGSVLLAREGDGCAPPGLASRCACSPGRIGADLWVIVSTSYEGAGATRWQRCGRVCSAGVARGWGSLPGAMVSAVRMRPSRPCTRTSPPPLSATMTRARATASAWVDAGAGAVGLLDVMTTTADQSPRASGDVHEGGPGVVDSLEAARRSSVHTAPAQQARYVQTTLGSRLAAACLGKDTRTLASWAEGRPIKATDGEHRLQVLYRATVAVETTFGPAVAAAFLRGTNPVLGENAPMLVIADQPPAQAEAPVMLAVRALLEA